MLCLCDLPRRFERCCSAELESDDRMFDGLQACIIVIVGARGGSRSGRDTGCEWTRGWVSCSVLEGAIGATTPSAVHTRCQLMRPSRARPPRRRTVRTARDLDEADGVGGGLQARRAFCSTLRKMLLTCGLRMGNVMPSRSGNNGCEM